MDLLLYEGNKVLFRLAMALFKLYEKNILSTHDFSDEFMLLQSMTKNVDFDLLLQVGHSFLMKIV